MPSCIVLLIFGYFVNEEQRQHLYPLKEQAPFPLNMGLYSFAYLYPAELLLAYLAHGIARKYFFAVHKGNGIVAPVNAGNDMAFPVFLQPPD